MKNTFDCPMLGAKLKASVDVSSQASMDSQESRGSVGTHKDDSLSSDSA